MGKQSREEFEKYIAKETGYPLVFIEGQRASNGYYNEFIDIPWRTWQASRAEIAVKLPEALIPAVHTSGEPFMRPEPLGFYLNRDDAIKAIKAQGLTVK